VEERILQGALEMIAINAAAARGQVMASAALPVRLGSAAGRSAHARSASSQAGTTHSITLPPEALISLGESTHRHPGNMLHAGAVVLSQTAEHQAYAQIWLAGVLHGAEKNCKEQRQSKSLTSDAIKQSE